MAAKQTVVRDEHVISNHAIMSDMRPGHEEILIADFCGAAIGAAPVDGAVLADDVAVPNFDLGISFWRKRNILRRHPDNGAVPDQVSVSGCDLAVDHHVRLQDGLIADRYVRPNYRKRTDLHLVADSRIRIDDSHGMNLGVRHTSDFDIRISDFRAYNTPASLKLK